MLWHKWSGQTNYLEHKWSPWTTYAQAIYVVTGHDASNTVQLDSNDLVHVSDGCEELYWMYSQKINIL